MQIAVQCSSHLIQASLEIFLSKYLSKKESDLLISDQFIESEKPLFVISNVDKNAHLKKPFSKQQLLDQLHSFYEAQQPHIKETKSADKNGSTPYNEIEKEVNVLLGEYTQKLSALFEKHYQNNNTN